LANYIGPHKIMWATDYPHSDGFFPGAPQMIGERIGLLSPEARHQVNGRGRYGVLQSELTAGLAGSGKEVGERALSILQSHSPVSTLSAEVDPERATAGAAF
jgi:hypothetical protein